MSVTAAEAAVAPVRPKIARDEWVMRGLMVLFGALLLVAVVLPLGAMFIKSVQNRDDEFVGLANFATYFDTPALFYSVYNSLTIAIISTVVVIGVGFVYAYALTRSCMPWKPFFRAVALIPILAPSLLPAIALVYLFGNQGFARELLLGESIYGPIGIVLGSAFWTFPHALMILVTAMSLADQRLYEASTASSAPSSWCSRWSSPTSACPR